MFGIYGGLPGEPPWFCKNYTFCIFGITVSFVNHGG